MQNKNITIVTNNSTENSTNEIIIIISLAEDIAIDDVGVFVVEIVINDVNAFDIVAGMAVDDDDVDDNDDDDVDVSSSLIIL